MKRKLALLAALIWVSLTPLCALAQDMSSMGGVSVVEYTVTRGGGTGESRTVSHSRSNTTSITPYDALEKELPSQPMTQLTMGGTALDLTLSGDGAVFTASLQGENTLVLNAAGDAAVWQFDGQTLRMLHNSGIAQLALRQGDSVALLPTDGLLSGYAYDALKMAGVPSKGFAFSVDVAGQAVTITAQDKVYTPGEPGASLNLNGVEFGGAELLAAE